MRNILSTPVKYMVYLPSEAVPNETFFNPDKFDLLYYKARGYETVKKRNKSGKLNPKSKNQGPKGSFLIH